MNRRFTGLFNSDTTKTRDIIIQTEPSNACIKSWFSSDKPLTLDSLKAKTEKDKVKGRLRIAYQYPEQIDGACGRTFEDAFIFANIEKFGLKSKASDELENEAYLKAMEYKKSDFALNYSIADTDWVAPQYFLDGLRWLSANDTAALDSDIPDSPIVEDTNA